MPSSTRAWTSSKNHSGKFCRRRRRSLRTAETLACCHSLSGDPRRARPRTRAGLRLRGPGRARGNNPNSSSHQSKEPPPPPPPVPIGVEVGGVVTDVAVMLRLVSSVAPLASVTRKLSVKVLGPVTCNVVVPLLVLAIVGVAPVTLVTLH